MCIRDRNLEGQLKMIRAFQPDAKKIGILYNLSLIHI